LLDSDKVFIDYVLKQFEYLEQKRSGGGGRRGGDECVVDDMTSSTSSTSTTATTISDALAKSYLVDLNETFDSETLVSDPLNPFDLDQSLNRLYAHLNAPNSASFSSRSSESTSPLVSSLYQKQQEHQRGHLILPKLFDFLILLSHEKTLQQQQHPQTSANKPTRPIQTSLVTVPEIIQLCDNLIASENSPHTHAIPSLRPLVIDLFLHRSAGSAGGGSGGGSDESVKELEMQHDVVMVTLLRLINYPQVGIYSC
jgi:hypothetical protein